jgi:EAL domain-containing protein (putative c-di-GMP-specific phosphodiesterase class I)
VQVCIDDFGTGYSSLTYLQRLPVDWLKIDKSFVAHLDDDEPTRRIVRAIVDMAHDLGLRVTAEGVDTPAKVEIARDLGCDEAQGYHCGRPGPPDEIDRLLAAQRRRES